MVMKRLLILLLCVMLVSCKSQQVNVPEGEEGKDLKYYPYFFLDGFQNLDTVLVIDDYASEQDKESAESLASSLSRTFGGESPKLLSYPSEFRVIGSQNSIMVGSCSQKPMNKFANVYVDCLSFRPGQALIRIVRQNEAWVLYVIGDTPDSTSNAVKVLSSYKDYDIQGQDIEVMVVDGKFKIGEPT